MANGRLWLAMPSGKKMLLAKFYPGTGWYPFGDTDRRLQELLDSEEVRDSISNEVDGTFPIKLEFE